MTKPRGVRNHNPGNLRHGPKWKGLRPEQTDREFAQFVSAEWGVRAMAITLTNYQAKHNLRTVKAIIGRWAPPSENDTGAYVAHVAQRLGVAPTDRIDVRRWLTMRGLVAAIIAHENRGHVYPDAVIDFGLEGVGIRRPV